MSTLKALFSISLLLWLAGCSSSSENYKNTKIRFYYQGKDWKEIDPDQSDYATYNTKTNSIMIVNSYCKKYANTSLYTLRGQILSGIADTQILEEKMDSFEKRKMLSTSLTGNIDGVKRFFHINILKKNRCLYDFMLITSDQQLLQNHQNDLDKLMTSSQIP